MAAKQKPAKSSSRRLSQSALCPCDSGLKYGECCWSKTFRWEVDKKGNVFRVVPISKELVEGLDAAEERFREIFGRAPRKAEPVLVEAWAFPQSDFDEGFIKTAVAANIRPELLYATYKTGLIVGEENADRATALELAEWNDAIDEYFDRYGENATVGQVAHDLLRREWSPALSRIKEDTFAAICVLTNFTANLCAQTESEFCRSYMTARALETSRSIYRMIEGRYTEDSLILIRSVYETAVNLAYLKARPGAADYFLGRAGLLLGSHEVRNSVPGRKGRWVVSKHDGHISRLNIPMSERVSETGSSADIELHDVLYGYLSGFVHSGIDPHLSLLGNGAIHIHQKSRPTDGLTWLFVSLALLIDALADWSANTAWQQADLQRLRKRFQGSFRRLVKELPSEIVAVSPMAEARSRLIPRS